MNDQFQDYTPDEKALKQTIDALAWQIEADPQFVKALEQKLAQHEASASTRDIVIKRGQGGTMRRTLYLVGSLAATLVCVAMIAMLSLSGGNESGDAMSEADNSEPISNLMNVAPADSNLGQTGANAQAGIVANEAPAQPGQQAQAEVAAIPTMSAPVEERTEATSAALAQPTAAATMLAAQATQPLAMPTGTPLSTATAAGTTVPPQVQATAAAATNMATPAPTSDIPADQMPPDMFFENYGVNPFLDTEDDHLSTFAMDVDTASYTLARNYLSNVGQLPPAEAIRSEEFINYFDMNYPSPEEGSFGINLEAAPAPFGYDNHLLLRVGIQGRYIAPEERDPVLLIFVIDISGSMEMDNRLGLVKQSLALLVDELREDDRVGIVVYSDNSRPILQPTPASNKQEILSVIDALRTEGSTNAEAGLRLGYQMAAEHMRDGSNTRVILLSDGVANVGITGPGGILETVSEYVEQGVTLSTIGFGMGNYNDTLMEQLANDGNGNYYYVDTLREADRIFTYNLTGTLQVIGYDAKVQVDFNPDVTDRYRLIGYENRAVADADFRNDAVDAGEVGAGHSITALYELALEDADPDDVIATAYIRYEDAETREVVEISQPITVADILPDIDEATPTFRLAAAAAEFSELLRESYWAEDGNYVDLLMFAEPLIDQLAGDESVAELVDLIRTAGRLVDR